MIGKSQFVAGRFVNPQLVHDSRVRCHDDGDRHKEKDERYEREVDGSTPGDESSTIRGYVDLRNRLRVMHQQPGVIS